MFQGVISKITRIWRSAPKNEIRIFTEKTAISSIKRLIQINGVDDENEKQITLVLGSEDLVAYEVIKNLEDCTAECDVTLDIFSPDKNVLEKMSEIINKNKCSKLKLGETHKVDYNGHAFIVTPKGYYFQDGPNFSHARAVFIKDSITKLLENRVAEILHDSNVA